MVEKYFGKELSTKIFGEKQEKITLPVIPKIDQSAKSLKVFSKNESVNVKLDPEKERKSNLGYIAEIYDVTREVKPDSASVSNWMNALSQGGTREGLYRALVLDATYAGLENEEIAVSDKSANFAVYFLGEFLDRDSKVTSIQKSNHYTLKRVITEKSLEVVDEFIQSNKDNLYRWYAVFSGELAKKYPSSFSNKIRKSSNREAHYKWAQTVPIQHIKSEVIIKLHKVFNHLK